MDMKAVVIQKIIRHYYNGQITLFLGLIAFLIMTPSVAANSCPPTWSSANHKYVDLYYLNNKLFMFYSDSGNFGKRMAVLENGDIVDIWDVPVSKRRPPSGLLYAHDKYYFFLEGRSEGHVYISRDGINWEDRPFGIRSYVGFHVYYLNNTFIATVGQLDSTGTDVYVSDDGLDWYAVGSIISNDVYGLTYGNGLFVAVGDDASLNTSSDGQLWEKRVVPDQPYDVTYGNGLFVAVGSNASVYTSSDGQQWEKHAVPDCSELHDLVFGEGTMYAACLNGEHAKIYSSANGEQWSLLYGNGTAEDLYGVTFGARLFVAVGDKGRVRLSANARTWRSVDPITDSPLFGVTYGNNQFIAVGDRGTIITSTDGKNWVAQKAVTQEPLYGVTFYNGFYVAVGGTLGRRSVIITSQNGHDWMLVQQRSGPAILAAAGGNNKFVAVGENGAAFCSNDGTNWNLEAADQGNFGNRPLQGIEYVKDADGKFLVAGGDGTGMMFYSFDGAHWYVHGACHGSMFDIAFGDGKFVAVGANGNTCYAPWHPMRFPTYKDLQ